MEVRRHWLPWGFIYVAVLAICAAEVDNETSRISLQFLTNATVEELKQWEAPEEFQRNYRYYLSGFDNENRPVWVMEMGRWNFKDVVEAGGKRLYEFDKYLDQAMYRMVTSVNLKNEADDPVTDYVLIVDMDKFDLFSYHSLATLQYFLARAPKLLKSTDNLDTGFFVNVSFPAERFLNVMKAAMGGFFSKMEVYGTNKHFWQPKLVRRIPPDQLSPQYGGTRSKPYYLMHQTE